MCAARSVEIAESFTAIHVSRWSVLWTFLPSQGLCSALQQPEANRCCDNNELSAGACLTPCPLRMSTTCRYSQNYIVYATIVVRSSSEHVRTSSKFLDLHTCAVFQLCAHRHVTQRLAVTHVPEIIIEHMNRLNCHPFVSCAPAAGGCN